MLQVIEAVGVCVDEVAVDPAFPQQQVQDAVEQGDIRARQDAEVQVGQLAGVGAAWVDDDDLHIRPLRFGVFQTAEQHGVCIGHVAANDQHAIALFDVFVTARRRVGTEAAFVANHSRRHAQARIRVDVVGADQCAGELVEGVIVLGQ